LPYAETTPRPVSGIADKTRQAGRPLPGSPGPSDVRFPGRFELAAGAAFFASGAGPTTRWVVASGLLQVYARCIYTASCGGLSSAMYCGTVPYLRHPGQRGGGCGRRLSLNDEQQQRLNCHRSDIDPPRPRRPTWLEGLDPLHRTRRTQHSRCGSRNGFSGVVWLPLLRRTVRYCTYRSTLQQRPI